MKIMEEEFPAFIGSRCTVLSEAVRPDDNLLYRRTQLNSTTRCNRIGYFRQPGLMIQGLLLNIYWWADLIMFLPRFFQVNRTIKNYFKDPNLNTPVEDQTTENFKDQGMEYHSGV